MMVANLAGASAESIGANSLLCRVSAYFHDVGKLERPLFFIENNRSDENPHNKLDPYVSKAMLVAHVTEGVIMLKEHKMPKVIVDITEQHHGTTLTGFFYRKVLEGLSDEEKASFDANSFRYPGPKPQTMEAVCVMIADSVEASVRSIKQPTRDLIAQKVDAIIKEKLDDKQFNDCDVTLKELESIGNVMKQVLYGTIHERIEYPDQEAKISDSDKLGK
jgi:putative nucleotidyltransferase with HDIG domain